MQDKVEDAVAEGQKQTSGLSVRPCSLTVAHPHRPIWVWTSSAASADEEEREVLLTSGLDLGLLGDTWA